MLRPQHTKYGIACVSSSASIKVMLFIVCGLMIASGVFLQAHKPVYITLTGADRNMTPGAAAPNADSLFFFGWYCQTGNVIVALKFIP